MGSLLKKSIPIKYYNFEICSKHILA